MTPDEVAKLPYRACVGVMLVNAAGHVFVGQRIDNDTPAWQMPQGGVDEGENPQTAAFRELWEETGVPGHLATVEAETAGWLPYDLPHDLVPRIWKGRFRGQEQKRSVAEPATPGRATARPRLRQRGSQRAAGSRSHIRRRA